MKKLALYKCFNPRTHTGCDPFSDTSYTGYNKFQSTHPHGVRPQEEYKSIIRLPVSIHAPPRGATFFVCAKRVIYTGFQSTHPHGVRLYDYHLLSGCNSFNPRTHTGCDMTPRGRVGGEIKFQSTHPHGVRLPSLLIATPYPAVSIHAPTRGATPLRFRQ